MHSFAADSEAGGARPLHRDVSPPCVGLLHVTKEALSEEQVSQAWRRVYERTKQLQAARESQVWDVAAGSPLAGDDRVSNPWYTSHAAANALSAAVDHLHALSVLVCEARVLHTNADFTLARCCLENAAIAIWICRAGPPSRAS